jgi:putative endonuclease
MQKSKTKKCSACGHKPHTSHCEDAGWCNGGYGCCCPYKNSEEWAIYLLRCSDDTLYCGITNDLQSRIDAHNSGKGAKYTRGRTPVKLVKYFSRPTKSEALKLERQIKKMTVKEKEAYKDEKRSVWKHT